MNKKNIYIIPTDTCIWIACPVLDYVAYKKLYEIKHREFDKLIAIMVLDFDFFEKNTLLNKNQIEFLKNYNFPFSVLANLKDDFLPEKLPNRDLYKKVSFRIAHNEIQKKLIEKVWPIFLTSANKSHEKEIYSFSEIEKVFEKNLDEIEIIKDKENLSENNLPSNIFEFVWETTEIVYLRKNYIW